MLSFLSKPGQNQKDAPAEPAPVAKSAVHPLDELTGGAFSAPTSGERAAKVRAWLATDPAVDSMAEVFKELSHRDKGAAKALKERLDEIKRSKGQEALVAEWAARAQGLLSGCKVNVADALAWQRDAAKAGAPLSKPPLAELRAQLAELVKRVEDLQNRVLVHRESALLLAQRGEGMSSKSLAEALAVREGFMADVANWAEAAKALETHADLASVDAKTHSQLQTAGGQLQAVAGAFSAAVEVGQTALSDASAPLPGVPQWADEVRAQRGHAVLALAEPASAAAKPAVVIDPAERAAATEAVQNGIEAVEKELGEGHTKALHKAVNDLRATLKLHGRKVGHELDQKAHQLLNQAGDLEGWQRWRADQIRTELVMKAEALAAPYREAAAQKGAAKSSAPGKAVVVKVKSVGGRKRLGGEEAVVAQAEAAPLAQAAADGELPSEAPTMESVAIEVPAGLPVAETAAEAQTESAPIEVEPSAEAAPPQAPPSATDTRPQRGLGGKKMQIALRELRDQWKQTDAGGAPNHGLWRRFDEACNAAYTAVAEWLDKIRAEESANKAQRQGILAELNAWAAGSAELDHKAQNRALYQFTQRWRDAGHVGEKAFDQLQNQWKAAFKAASAAVEAAASASIERRKALIAHAHALAESVPTQGLRIDAVKQLQGDWQREAQAVALDRRLEQKLWEQFRAAVDGAFAAKSAQREQANERMSARDQRVLQAAKALEAANATGDAAAIRSAMDSLQAAINAREEAVAEPAAAPAAAQTPVSAENGSVVSEFIEPVDSENVATEPTAPATESTAESSVESRPPAAPAPAVVAVAKPVVAVVARRGDDRPGGKSAAPAGEERRGGFGGRDGGRNGGRPGGPGQRPGERTGQRPDRSDRGQNGSERPEGRPAALFGGDRFGGDRFGGDRFAPRDAAPRLGDAAFRAQREALESAQAQLRKLSAMAHGEAITGLLDAWQKRDATALPNAATLGKSVTASLRSQLEKAIAAPAKAESEKLANQSLLRLEMAAEVPTPAAQILERRALQLQMLTQRHAEPPSKTWGLDLANALQAAHDDVAAQRLRTALKVLMR